LQETHRSVVSQKLIFQAIKDNRSKSKRRSSYTLALTHIKTSRTAIKFYTSMDIQTLNPTMWILCHTFLLLTAISLVELLSTFRWKCASRRKSEAKQKWKIFQRSRKLCSYRQCLGKELWY